MTTQLSDGELMQRILQQDQQALDTLYTRYGGPVFSLACRIVRHTGIAEEVTQDIFLRVWERAATWDPNKGKLSSWLLTITRYAAIDRLRKEKRRPPVADIDLGDMPHLAQQTARVNDPRWQDGQILRDLLKQIPAEQAEAIELAFFGGLTHNQLAETLNLPLGTVKTRVRLGLQKLKSLWLAASDNL